MVTLRPARFADLARLIDMLVEQHAQSSYAGFVGVDRAAAQKMLSGQLHRNGNVYDGGALCNVIEVDGTIEAFMLGALQRVYLIGDKLEAVDVFLVATTKANATAWHKLVAAYLEWAEKNIRVVQIWLSHTDALPTGARMGRSYARLGFSKSGEMWCRRKLPIELKDAA